MSLSCPGNALLLIEKSPKQVETVTLHGLDLTPPAFGHKLSLDFETLPTEGLFLPQDVESAPTGSLKECESVPAKLDSAYLCIEPDPPVKHGVCCPVVVPSTENTDSTALLALKVFADRVVVPPMYTEDLAEVNLAPSVGNEAEPETGGASVGERSESTAATKLQKVYKSYRTRRRLADSAVVAEELWWQALDFARLNHSTISFFNYAKPETAISRWYRVTINASKVGQGLSKDSKALKLAFQHWIEAIDPRHRYGHNLHIYYEKWCDSDAGQPFFYWLDLGDGRNVELKECPRSLLRQQCVKYLGPQERLHYEYVPADGKIVHKQTAEPLDTVKGSEGEKWIFVMSTSRRLYAGVKKKGTFQHSSFLAGGSAIVAGRFTAEDGFLKAIWAYSGHYKPTDENLDDFLNYLQENGIDLTEVEIRSSSSEEYEETQTQKPERETNNGKGVEMEAYKRSLSGRLQSPKADVSEKAIQERIKSKMESRSYQLGHQLSLNWSTGAGPRIGCVADYPVELRVQALEFTDLSPRRSPAPTSHLPRFSSSLSPTSNTI